MFGRNVLVIKAQLYPGLLGIAAVIAALSVADRTGAACWNAELYRLKGELLLMKCNASEAEACFREAIGQRQGAKSFELRATMSLARLLQKKGERLEARQILGAIYGWFTEGFETADLKEAKALLEGIS